jgi:serine/threonine protein phosphatase PrpC
MLTSWSGHLASDGGWALVADGLGGHAAGEVASVLAIEIMRPVMSALRTDHDVATALLSADTALYLAMDQDCGLEGMGTTIAGVVVRGEEILAFNVGDSRIYHLGDAGLTQFSADDVVGRNRLTQCLGGSQAQVKLNPHVARFPFRTGDTLLLCSDGLTDMLPDKTIGSLLVAADPAAALIAAALEAGGHDNVSAVILRRVLKPPLL